MKQLETKKNIINIISAYSREFGIAPYFVESTLSYAVGVPPLCIYPSTVHLASNPVNSCNCFATFGPIPPNLMLIPA